VVEAELPRGATGDGATDLHAAALGVRDLTTPLVPA